MALVDKRDRTVRSPRRRSRARRWALRLAALAGAALVAIALAAWTLAPSVSDLPKRVRGQLRDTGGVPVALSDVAPTLREAVVATEDERFYRHHGIDIIGVARALAYDVSHLSLSQGASTITEQLAKELYLGGNDESPWRKLEDAAMALRIESRLSKEQILGDYLNTVYFGNGAYGIGAASERYFALPPSELTLAQASLLAGLVQAPSAYDPFSRPLVARERQAAVLRSMIRNGYITTTEGARALDVPLPLSHGPALPPVPGLSLDSGPALSGPQIAAALALLGSGLVGVVVARRRRVRPLWRLAPLASLGAAALLAARAIRVD